jgi:hypothetical protein
MPLSGGGGGAGLGGAIFNMGASNIPGSGILVITNSTLTANTAQGGGSAACLGGSGYGGAVFNLDGSVTINDSTLAANTVAGGASESLSPPGTADGGAVYNLAFGNDINTGGTTRATLTLFNSILSNSAGGTDVAGQIVNGTGGNAASVGGSTNLVMSTNLGGTVPAAGVITATANPNLGPLHNNGGPTLTMALTASSPAYGAGNPKVSGLPATDQRGLPRLNNGRLDLGAFEVQNPVLGSSPPSNTTPGSSTSALQELVQLAVDEFLLTIENVLALIEMSVGIASDPALAASIDATSNAINANPQNHTLLGDAVLASTFSATMNQLAMLFVPAPG